MVGHVLAQRNIFVGIRILFFKVNEKSRKVGLGTHTHLYRILIDRYMDRSVESRSMHGAAKKLG